MQGWRGHGGRVMFSPPFHMGFSWVQTSHGILWHTEPHRELSIPTAAPQGAVAAGERVLRQLTALPAPADRREIWGGQGHHKLRTLWEVRSPREGGRGLPYDAPQPLGTMQGMNKGSRGVTLQRSCPCSLRESTGTCRTGPRCRCHPRLAVG